ncbi:MAG: type II toxin-antitoxin system VapB family antitoxin [Puniceicoccaceae bacterium]
MKLTIDLDKELLERVVKLTGARTRTEAISTALREIDRRGQLVALLREGTGAKASELKEMFDPKSDPVLLRVAEEQHPYGGGAS